MNVFILGFIFLVLAEDYYKLLGVDKNADEKTIRKEFKKLSLEFHPDRGNQGTQDHYMKLSLAYEVLTNPAKREVYDKYGEEGISIGGLKYNVNEIYDNYFGQDYPGKFRWYNFLYQGSSVIELTEQTLKAFEHRKDPWILQFYGSRSKKSTEFTGVWKNIAKRMEGILKVAAVNCDVNEDLCKDHNIKKFPVIIFFSDNKEDSILFKGSKDYRSLNSFIIDSLPGKLEPLDQTNFSQFLTNEPQLAKILLFSENKEIWTVIKPVARTFEGKVLIGDVKNTEKELVDKFGVKTFPAMVAVTVDGFENFVGKFGKVEIRQWVERIITEHKFVPQEVEKESIEVSVEEEVDKGVVIEDKEHKSEFFEVGVEKPEVFSEKQEIGREDDGRLQSLNLEFDRVAYENGNCSKSDPRFCFLAVDPDLQMRNVLDRLVLKFVNDPVSVFWMSSKKNKRFVERLGGKNVIIRGKKKKFCVVECKGGDLACFVEALENSLAGSREFLPLQGEIHYEQREGL